MCPVFVSRSARNIQCGMTLRAGVLPLMHCWLTKSCRSFCQLGKKHDYTIQGIALTTDSYWSCVRRLRESNFEGNEIQSPPMVLWIRIPEPNFGWIYYWSCQCKNLKGATMACSMPEDRGGEDTRSNLLQKFTHRSKTDQTKKYSVFAGPIGAWTIWGRKQGAPTFHSHDRKF